MFARLPLLVCVYSSAVRAMDMDSTGAGLSYNFIIGVCIDGVYPLFATAALASTASMVSTSHAHAFGNFTNYMPNGMYPGMHMTQGTACEPGEIDATGLLAHSGDGHLHRGHVADVYVGGARDWRVDRVDSARPRGRKLDHPLHARGRI